jgi:hypothetical protein
MGPAAALLALLCVGPIAASFAADQHTSSACRWSSHRAAEQEQCPVALWYSAPREDCSAGSVDTQTAVGQATAAAQQLGDHKEAQNYSIKSQNEPFSLSASSLQGSTAAASDRQVYIVRFKQYRMLSDLRDLLETVSSTLINTCRVCLLA